MMSQFWPSYCLSPRPVFTWAFLAFGVLFLALAAIATGWWVIVPWAGWENERWRSPDNPIRVREIGKMVAAGGLCLWLSRASDRVRWWAAGVLFLTGVVAGVYEIT